MREVGAPRELGFEARDHLELAGHADRHGARRQAVGRPLRLSPGGARDARAGAGALGAGAARGPRLRTRDTARAGPRARALRDRLPARHRAADLRPSRGRAVPGRHLGGRPRLAARRRDPRGRAAAAALRRLLSLLPARGRRGRQGHPRHLPRAPVRQGRDVQLRRDPRTRPPSTSGSWRSRRRSCELWGCPTG